MKETLTQNCLNQKNQLITELELKERFRLEKQQNGQNNKRNTKSSNNRITEIGLLFDESAASIVDFCKNYDNYVGMFVNNINDGDNKIDARNKWLLNLDEVDKYDRFSEAINNISDLILVVLKELTPGYEINVNIPEYFSTISDFDYRDLGFSKYTNTFLQPKLRYIRTSSFKQLDKILRDDEIRKRVKAYRIAYNRLSDIASDEDLCNYGYAQMVISLGLQSRFLDCCGQISSILCLKQRRSYYESHGHEEDSTDKYYKRGIDLVGMYTIKLLLNKYTLMPFIETNYRYFPRVSEKDCVANLPQFIYALLQIAVLEFTNVYNKTDAELAVKYLFENSGYSLCQGYLDSRGRLRDIEMHLIMKLSTIRTIERSENATPVRSLTLDNFIDFNFEELNKSLPKLVEKMTPTDIEIYNRLCTKITMAQKLNDPDKVLHQVVHCRMLLYCITCPSIFNKTSLKLEYEKSASPVIKEGMNYPPVTESIVLSDGSTIPIAWDWDKSNLVFRDIKEEFDLNYRDELIMYLKKLDFEARYADVMTNRSEGVKTISSDIPEALQKISNTRTISLALNPDDMNVWDKFLGKLRSGGKCTIRYQIDRRARVVVMVIKQKQSQQIINLEGFNKLKTLCESVDVGRQKGDIRNCAFQLYSSSGTRGLCNSSDMKGQDAHTLPITTDFINDLYMQTVRDNNHKRMFFSNETEYDVLHHQENRVVRKKLSGIFKLGALVMRNDKPTKYVLDDKFFTFQEDDPFIVSDFTFPSGLYGTTAQHTTLLALDHDSSVRAWNEHHGVENRIWSAGRFVGDDKFQLIWGKDDDIRKFLEFSKLRYKVMNFESETTYSYIFATFLQNDCIGGVYCPKPHRMSMFTEEKGEVHRRERLSVIQNIISTCRIFAQRTFSPDNVGVIIFNIWNLLRVYNYGIDKELQKKLHHPFVKHIKDGLIRIILPIWSCYEAPLYGPLPSLYSKVHNIAVKAVDMTYGSGNGQRLHILNSLPNKRIPLTINQCLRFKRTTKNIWIYGRCTELPQDLWVIVELMTVRNEMVYFKKYLDDMKANEFIIVSELNESVISKVPPLYKSNNAIIRGQGYNFICDLPDLEDALWLIRISCWFISGNNVKNGFDSKSLPLRLIHIANGVFLTTVHEREALNFQVGSEIKIYNNFINDERLDLVGQILEIIDNGEITYFKTTVQGSILPGISTLLLPRGNLDGNGFYVQTKDDDMLIAKTSIYGETSTVGFYGACSGVYLIEKENIVNIVGLHWAGSKVHVNTGILQKLTNIVAITTPLISIQSKRDKVDFDEIYLFKKSRNLSSWLITPLENIPSHKLEFLKITEIYDFLTWSRDKRLEKVRIEEIDEFRVQKLVNFYKQYQNREDDMRSKRAKRWLENNGIEGGGGLAYYNRPRKKIEDSLIAREQDLTERAFIDKSFLEHLYRSIQRIKHQKDYKHSLPKIIKDQVNTFSLYLLPISEIKPHKDKTVLGTTRSLPSYGPYESFGALYYAVGGISNSTYLSAAEYRHLLNEFDINGGLENVLREAQRIVGQSPNRDEGIENFCDLIAIPRNRRQALRSLILEEIRTYHDVEYTTFYENQMFFDVNTNPNLLEHVIDKERSMNLQKYNYIIRVLNDFGTQIRDMYMNIASKYKKYAVIVHPYSYIKYVLSRRINPSEFKYVKELLS